jgi:hypothetical protein
MGNFLQLKIRRCYELTRKSFLAFSPQLNEEGIKGGGLGLLPNRLDLMKQSGFPVNYHKHKANGWPLFPLSNSLKIIIFSSNPLSFSCQESSESVQGNYHFFIHDITLHYGTSTNRYYVHVLTYPDFHDIITTTIIHSSIP